ncbi:insulinase family protein [bacterium]|nr:insulinase family protein [bacterium]
MPVSTHLTYRSLVTAALCAAVAVAPCGAAGRAAYTEVTDAGLGVHVAAVPGSPVVAVRISVRGGLLAEGAYAGSGLAQAVREMLFLEIMRVLRAEEATGAYMGSVSAGSTHDAAWFSVVTPRDTLGGALRAVAAVLNAPQLSVDDWRAVREQAGRRAATRERDVKALLKEALLECVHPDDPLRFPIEGAPAQYAGLKVDDLKRFHAREYTADRLSVVVAGDVAPEAVAQEIKTAFAAFRRRAATALPACVSPLTGGPRRIERLAAITQAHVCVAVSTAGAFMPGAAEAEVIAALLRHDAPLFTPPSRAFGRARQEQSLGDAVRMACGEAVAADVDTWRPVAGEGYVLVTVACPPAAAGRVAAAVNAWLGALTECDWRDEDIIAAAKRCMVARAARLASVETLAEDMNAAVLCAQNARLPDGAIERIAAATPGRVRAACASLMRPERMTVVVLRPRVSAMRTDAEEALLAQERSLLGIEQAPLRRVMLENGVTLLFRTAPGAPSVNIIFSAIGGLWCENEYDNGAFATLGRIMRHATRTREPGDLARACDAAGLAPQSAVRPNTFVLFGQCLPGDAPAASRLLAEMWSEPRFDNAGLDAAIAAGAAALGAQADNAYSLADLAFRSLLFTSRPYGLNELGSPASLRRMALSVLERTHHDFITPRNTTILIAGDVDEAAVETAFRASLKRFVEREKSDYFISHGVFQLHGTPPYLTVRLPADAARTNAAAALFAAPRDDVLVTCGIPLPGMNDTNAPPALLDVVRAALRTELDALRAEWRDLENTPVIASAGCDGARVHDGGWAYVYCTVSLAHGQEATRRIQVLVARAADRLGTDAGFLDAVRRRALFEHQARLAAMPAAAEYIALYAQFGYDTLYSRSFETYARNVTPAQINSALRDHARFPVTALIAPQD